MVRYVNHPYRLANSFAATYNLPVSYSLRLTGGPHDTETVHIHSQSKISYLDHVIALEAIQWVAAGQAERDCLLQGPVIAARTLPPRSRPQSAHPYPTRTEPESLAAIDTILATPRTRNTHPTPGLVFSAKL